MTTKITIIYDTPRDPNVFAARQADQMALAAGISRLRRVETHRMWPTGQALPVLAYQVTELFFEDAQAVQDAMDTQAAGSFLSSLIGRGGANGVHILYHDEEL